MIVPGSSRGRKGEDRFKAAPPATLCSLSFPVRGAEDAWAYGRGAGGRRPRDLPEHWPKVSVAGAPGFVEAARPPPHGGSPVTVTNAPLLAEVGGAGPPPPFTPCTAPCPSLLSHPGAPVLSEVIGVRIHLKITDPLFTRRELGQEVSLVA